MLLFPRSCCEGPIGGCTSINSGLAGISGPGRASGCIMVVGLPLNVVSLWILHHRHSFKSPNAVFMINLAISDLLLIISLPMRIYFYATGSWILGKLACVSVTMLFRNNLRSSSIFMTFISVDRLLAVVYPLSILMTLHY
ncbi:unnamed protein product [Menidia menidia]|uniref:(Atlantic silverside) hypothetical protein n=1 Tax=Menidia menidia TaxID=238744 RepID=A0A8S4BT47_9TELE|nr:unnamed protein product [Menidia menidia]